MVEEWKDIQGYEGIYQISNLGRVRSLDRYTHVKCDKYEYDRKTKGRILKPKTMKCRYYAVDLCNEKGVMKEFTIHRLVAQAFLPDFDSSLTVNHKDGNHFNNCVNNLEMTTIVGNNNHALAQGLNVGSSKLNVSDVLNIRRLHREGYSYTDIAAMYNLTRQSIYCICTYRTWKFIS